MDLLRPFYSTLQGESSERDISQQSIDKIDKSIDKQRLPALPQYPHSLSMVSVPV
jgi:hypothetical protein